jgi:hypothetical protein
MTYTLTEQQIEVRVERVFDHLDKVYLSGEMTQKDYDHAVWDLHRWAESAYQALEGRK